MIIVIVVAGTTTSGASSVGLGALPVSTASLSSGPVSTPTSTPTSTPPPDTGGGSTGGSTGKAAGNADNGKAALHRRRRLRQLPHARCGRHHRHGRPGPRQPGRRRSEGRRAARRVHQVSRSSIPARSRPSGSSDGVMPTTFGSSLVRVGHRRPRRVHLRLPEVAPPRDRRRLQPCAPAPTSLVEALEAHDVEVVFGLPGIHALPIWDALIGSPLRRVVVRHEQAAGFGAVGYARTGEQPGVYLTSTGPGAFNSLAALSEADASSAPVLHLTSQIPTDLVGAGRGYLHESRGQSQAFAAVSRFHARPTTPEALVAAVDEAFRPHGARPGAGHDRDRDRRDGGGCAGRRSARRARRAARRPILRRSRACASCSTPPQAPMMWAGGGARRAADGVRALAEALDAPVITTYNGKGALPTGHPLHAGSSVEEPSMRHLVERSDLVLALGTRFSQETTANWSAPDARRRSSTSTSTPAGSGARTRRPRGSSPTSASSAGRSSTRTCPAGSRDGEAAVRAAIQGRTPRSPRRASAPRSSSCTCSTTRCPTTRS